MSKKLWLATLSLLVFMPASAFACACGCGVFDVGTGTMMPTDTGGTVWMEWDYMDQNTNWSETGRSASANNPDTEIVSNFFVAGGQYMFSRDWGAEVDLPFTTRTFNTTDGGGNPASFNHGAFGDMRVKGIWSGLSDDMSTGLTYGLKLPTGDRSFSGFDRDSSIGTGSTDALLGFYHVGTLTGKVDWFANGQLDHALDAVDHYRPGDEWDGAVGSYYNLGPVAGGDKVAPLLQLLGSYRHHDMGANADPQDSGYNRLLISPGVEYDVQQVRLYADVEAYSF
jgi:hypothetical protein